MKDKNFYKRIDKILKKKLNKNQLVSIFKMNKKKIKTMVLK